MEKSQEKRSVSEFVKFVLKAIALAMSVAAIVLGMLGTAPTTLVPMLAIGLFCLAITALQE